MDNQANSKNGSLLNLYQDSDQNVPLPFSFGPLPPSPTVSSPSPAMERIVEVTEENTSSTENESVPKTEVEVLEYKVKAQDNRQEIENAKLKMKQEPPKRLPEDLSRDINQLKTRVKNKERDEEKVKSKDETRRRKHDKEQVRELMHEGRDEKDKKDKKKEHEDKKPHMNGGVKKHQRERKDKQKEHREDGKTNVPVKEKRERKEKKSSKKSERKSRKERAEKETEETMSLVEEEEIERARSRSREVGERLARHEHQCHHSGSALTHTHSEELDEVLSNKSSACDCPAHVHDRESPLQIAEVRDAVRVSRTLKNSEPSRFNF